MTTLSDFRLVRAAQALFFLNTGIWVGLGFWSLVKLAKGNSDSTITGLIIAAMMFGNALAMLASGIGLGKRQKRFFYLALAILLVNIILTVTDQFGILDFLTLVIDLALLGFLIADRRNYSI
jgi:hypothetical protein